LASAGRGDELVRLLWAGRDRPEQLYEAQLELLHEVLEGYPVENVRRLLTSGRASAVRAGVWVASELGRHAGPLVEEMASILDSSDGYAKLFAVDVVLLCGTDRHGHLIARVVDLVDDSDDSMRWKALQFLTNATSEQLSEGVRHIESGRLRTPIEWLLRCGDAADPDVVMERLGSCDRATRLVAAAAAARSAMARLDPAALDLAAAGPDQEVAAFASEQLELLAIRRHRSG
jgi:hypothetical protein